MRRWIEKSKIAFSAVAVESIDWNYGFAHRYSLATNSAKALQRAAESLLFKLPAAAAVQSSGPDLNKFVDYLPASALPARRTCRSDSASNLNVQRPRACAQANVQRPRAGLQASAGEQGGRSKKAFTKIRSDTCKYCPIFLVPM